ncbi:MAG: monovalent cation/H+ antiporter complex subunit F [Vicinamibacterales bacterium]
MIVTVLVVAALAALVLATVRLLRGPTLADRVVALDLALASSIALAGAAALVSGQPRLLDVAMGVAAVSFVGTIAWARIIERLARRGDS